LVRCERNKIGRELAGAVKEGLLAFSVGVGLAVLHLLMEEDVAVLAGVKGRRGPARRAVRHGDEDGSVALGGRRVPVRRPRARTADGTGELPVDLDGSITMWSRFQVAMEDTPGGNGGHGRGSSRERGGSRPTPAPCP